MAKTELGNKHQCNSCNTKFYDLQKEVPICPKCGEEIIIKIKPRLGRPPLNKKPEIKVKQTKKVSKELLVKEDNDELDEELDDLVSMEDLDESIINSNNDLTIENENEDNDSDNLSGIT
ncbi:MAG TPA: TIGR02300 family protein, partial [Alphaproteobacteria bacterium]|nr:TIGR02300 family protein [Alphaproteobacteria bacterium]